MVPTHPLSPEHKLNPKVVLRNFKLRPTVDLSNIQQSRRGEFCSSVRLRPAECEKESEMADCPTTRRPLGALFPDEPNVLIYAPSFTHRSDRSPVFEQSQRVSIRSQRRFLQLLRDMKRGTEGSDDDKLFPLRLGHIHHGDRKTRKTVFTLPHIF